MHGPRWGGGAGGSKQHLFDNGSESSASQAGLSQGTLDSCVVSTGRSAVVPPVSVSLRVQGGSGRGAVIPRGPGTPFDESEQRLLVGVAVSGVDGPVGEVVSCREPEPLAVTIVESSCRLSKYVGRSAMVGELQRCSSRENVGVSVLVDLEV